MIGAGKFEPRNLATASSVRKPLPPRAGLSDRGAGGMAGETIV